MFNYYIHALKATWIRRILKSGDLQWVKIFYKLSNLTHILDLEGGSVDISKVLNTGPKINAFWRDVFYAWAEIVKNHVPKSMTF